MNFRIRSTDFSTVTLVQFVTIPTGRQNFVKARLQWVVFCPFVLSPVWRVEFCIWVYFQGGGGGDANFSQPAADPDDDWD